MVNEILIIRIRNIYFRKKLIIKSSDLSKFTRICILLNISNISSIEHELRKLCPNEITFHNSLVGRRQLPYSTIFRLEILPTLKLSSKITFIGTDVTDYYFYMNSLLYCSRNLQLNIKYYDLKNWPNELPERKNIVNYVKDSKRVNCIPKWIKNKSYKIYSLSTKLTNDFIKSLNNINIENNKLNCLTIKIKNTNSILYIGNFLTNPITIKCDFELTLNSEDDFETCMRFYQLRDNITYFKRDIEHFYVGVISELKVINYMTFFPPRHTNLEKLFMMELF